jgi:hypothetical protein
VTEKLRKQQISVNPKIALNMASALKVEASQPAAA